MYAKKRGYWLKIHRILGVIVLFLGLYQVDNDLKMFVNSYEGTHLSPLYLIYIALSGGLVIVCKAHLLIFSNEMQRERIGMNPALTEGIEERHTRGAYLYKDHEVL